MPESIRRVIAFWSASPVRVKTLSASETRSYASWMRPSLKAAHPLRAGRQAKYLTPPPNAFSTWARSISRPAGIRPQTLFREALSLFHLTGLANNNEYLAAFNLAVTEMELGRIEAGFLKLLECAAVTRGRCDYGNEPAGRLRMLMRRSRPDYPRCWTRPEARSDSGLPTGPPQVQTGLQESQAA